MPFTTKAKKKHRPRQNKRNESVSLMPAPLTLIDPGLRARRLDTQNLKDHFPELSTMLQQIKSNYLDFISSKAIELGQIEIVPCLVGSQSQRFHPEPLLDTPTSQNDFDWEFFCRIKNPTAMGRFIDKLFSKIIISDYFSNDHKLNTRSISTHFNYCSGKIDTNVDVKFTIFTTQTTEDMIHSSMSNRVICPKATLIRFPRELEINPIISIHYYSKWLDFTINPIHQETKQYRPEFIAYALLFHYLNPHYPMTNRFIYTMTEFFRAAWQNTELLESTKIKFVALCCKKFCHSGAITSEVLLKPGEEFAEIFNSIPHRFFEPYGLSIINIVVLYNKPELVDFVPSSVIKLVADDNKEAKDAKVITAPPQTRSADKLTFFPHYKNIDSFCDAVIRQLILINSPRLAELSTNPMIRLKHKMNPDNGPVDMNQVFRRFNAAYPEISLIIYSSKFDILNEIRSTAEETFTMNLIQHGDRYSPLLSLQDAPRTREAEQLMSTIRLVEPW